MEVIREILAKYGHADCVHGIFKPGDLVEGDELVYRKEICHLVNVIDERNVWTLGQVDRADFHATSSEWELHTSYPNWRKSPASVIRVNPATGEETRIKPIQDHLFQLDSVQRNMPVPPEAHGQAGHPTNYAQVSCYISTEKQTLRKHFKWGIGMLRLDGSVRLNPMHVLGRSSMYRQVGATYITAPVSRFRRKHYSKYYNPKFKTLNDQIYAEVYAEVKKRKEKKKAAKKEENKVLRNIRKQKNVVLNGRTVKFLKRGNRIHVQKTCLAFKMGWVNKFGKPSTWEYGSTFVKGLPSNVFRFMSTFMDGRDFGRVASTNRKNNFDLMNHYFICAQSKELTKERGKLRKIYEKQRGAAMLVRGDLDSLEHAIKRMEERSVFTDLIMPLKDKKTILYKELGGLIDTANNSRDIYERVKKKGKMFTKYV